MHEDHIMLSEGIISKSNFCQLDEDKHPTATAASLVKAELVPVLSSIKKPYILYTPFTAYADLCVMQPYSAELPSINSNQRTEMSFSRIWANVKFWLASSDELFSQEKLTDSKRRRCPGRNAQVL